MDDNFILIKEQDAEVLIEILNEYPQNIKWTVKGVSVDNLRSRLIKQLAVSSAKVEFVNVKPTNSTL